MHFYAEWITHSTGPKKGPKAKYGNPSPYFRRTFSLKGEVERAELLAAAIGVFKLYLNGEPLGEDYLSPGFVDLTRRIPFVRYDLTGLLKKDNAVGAVLGDGWAVGHLGPPFRRNSYCDHPELSAEIRILYRDGTEERIGTDTTWRAAEGEIRRSDIYMGEAVDHRRSLGDFSRFDYDDSEWVPATRVTLRQSRSAYLDEMRVPPITVKHRFKPQLVSQKGKRYLFDVGQNVSGVVRCTLKGERGARFTLRHGEILVDGALYTDNLRRAEAKDVFILGGSGEEEFRPILTFHGFRYFEVAVTGEGEILSLSVEAMYSDLGVTGHFSTSNPLVNRIYQNALWSQRDNFLNVPTDCPQRDERLGWTADAQVFCRSAMYNMDCRVFYEKYMADVRDAQLGNGVVPAVAPVPRVGYRSYIGYGAAPGWAEAVAEIPWSHWVMYGDKGILRDNLYAAKHLLDYYEKTSRDGVRRLSGPTYGDWLSPAGITDTDALATMYFARTADLVGRMCRVLGDFEAERYEALFETVKAAFLETFSEGDRLLSDTQSIYLIAYSFGLIDGARARRNLERLLAQSEGKLACGFLGIRFLLPCLCELGMQAAAYGILLGEEYPGWGYSIAQGATTVWERWDSFTLDKGVHDSGMNSFNHYAFGSCTEWMYEYCLGIRPSEERAGFGAVLLRPYFDPTGGVAEAEGSYDTGHGTIRVRWRADGEEAEYRVALPEGLEAEFDFPGMRLLSESEEDGEQVFSLLFDR